MDLDALLSSNSTEQKQDTGSDLFSALSGSSQPEPQPMTQKAQQFYSLIQPEPTVQQQTSFFDDVQNNSYIIEEKRKSVGLAYAEKKNKMLSAEEVSKLPTEYITKIDDGDTVSVGQEEIRLDGFDTFETPHYNGEQKSSRPLSLQKTKVYQALGIEPTEQTIRNESALIHEAGQRDKLKLYQGLIGKDDEKYDSKDKDLDMSYWRNRELNLGEQRIPVKVDRRQTDMYGRTIATIYRADNGKNINEFMKTSLNQPKYINGKYVGEAKIFDKEELSKINKMRYEAIINARRHDSGQDEIWQNAKLVGLSALDVIPDTTKWVFNSSMYLTGKLLGYDDEMIHKAKNALPEFFTNTKVFRKNYGDEYYLNKMGTDFSKKFQSGDYVGAAGTIVSNPSAAGAMVLSETAGFILGAGKAKTVLEASKWYKGASAASQSLANKAATTLGGASLTAASRQLDYETEYYKNFGKEMSIGRRAATFGMNTAVLSLEMSLIGGALGKIMPKTFGKAMAPELGEGATLLEQSYAKTVKDMVYRAKQSPLQVAGSVFMSGAGESIQEVLDGNIEKWSKENKFETMDKNIETAFMAGVLGSSLHLGGTTLQVPSIINAELRRKAIKDEFDAKISGMTKEETDTLIAMSMAQKEAYRSQHEALVSVGDELEEAINTFGSNKKRLIDTISAIATGDQDFINRENVNEMEIEIAIRMIDRKTRIQNQLNSDGAEVGPDAGLAEHQMTNIKFDFIKDIHDAKDGSTVSVMEDMQDLETNHAISFIRDALDTINSAEEVDKNSNRGLIKEILSKGSDEITLAEQQFVVDNIDSIGKEITKEQANNEALSTVHIDGINDGTALEHFMFNFDSKEQQNTRKVYEQQLHNSFNASVDNHNTLIALIEADKRKKVDSVNLKNREKLSKDFKERAQKQNLLNETAGSLNISQTSGLVKGFMLDKRIETSDKTAVLKHIDALENKKVAKKYTDIINKIPEYTAPEPEVDVETEDVIVETKDETVNTENSTNVDGETQGLETEDETVVENTQVTNEPKNIKEVIEKASTEEMKAKPMEHLDNILPIELHSAVESIKEFTPEIKKKLEKLIGQKVC